MINCSYCIACGDTIFYGSLDQTCQCNKDDRQVKAVSVEKRNANWEVIVQMVNLTRKEINGQVVFSGSKEDCLVVKISYILSGECVDLENCVA